MKNLTILILLAALTGCSKKEATTETPSEVSHDDNVVTLTAQNLQLVTIKTQPVTLGDLGMTLRAAGRVSLNLNRTAKVMPTLEGRLTRVNFDLNDPVKAGEVLALVESPELLDKLLALKAPIDGVVVERDATVGELVGRDKNICTISDITELWVVAEVKERDIAAVRLGQEATFTVLAYPSEKFHGKVTLVGNQVETGPRTVEVRITVDRPDARLKPGMFADVAITTGRLESVLLVPDRALQTDGDDQIIFVALAGNRFEKRVVKLGKAQSGCVQIVDGVKAGESVVTEGGFILKSEMLKGQLGEE